MTRKLGLAVALWATACGPANDARPIVAASGCTPVLPAASYPYSDDDQPIPSHLLASTAGSVIFSDNTPRSNPITNAGATLGRVLFYDTRLSKDNHVSCASCHRQEFGFADTVRFSVGVAGREAARHTMALGNARFNARGRFFSDERAASLEDAVLVPIQDPLEMGSALGPLERELTGVAFYPALFAAAFGTPEIDRDRIARALAQFVRAMITARSPFDSVFSTGGSPREGALSEGRLRGFVTFNSAGCASCHRSITQFADLASNTGLDVQPADTGSGGGRFKPPSLRNVAIRAPYMHDGRFASLHDVVTFYDSGVHDTPDLDPRLRDATGAPRRLGLSAAQRDELVSFLEALTDSAFLRDVRFSDPFGCVEPGPPSRDLER